MQNIKTSVKGDKLTIEIDLKTDLGPSASGKTRLVASSKGNVQVEGTNGLIVGINAYRKA